MCGTCWIPLTSKLPTPPPQTPNRFPTPEKYTAPQREASASKPKDSKLGCGCFILIAIIIYAIYSFSTEKPSAGATTSPPYAPPPQVAAPRPVRPTQPLPAHGDMQNFTARHALAPFKVISSGGGYYFLKLVDSHTGADAIHLFVHSGQTAEIDVPLGTYRLKYATGKNWYGVGEYFGAETAYSESSSILDFSSDGNSYNGHSITLYKVKGGNMRTQNIGKTNF